VPDEGDGDECALGSWIRSIAAGGKIFGIRANFKDFHPPGAAMCVYINEQLRRKGTDHGEVLYWCGRPASGGGGLGFCPKRCTVYNRRHFNVDPRFVYGMYVGGQFEAMLKIHSKAQVV
jgi:hypothetical protein